MSEAIDPRALREIITTLETERDRLKERVRNLEETLSGSLLLARCGKHLNVPQLNSNESSGAECGACVREQALLER